jgi:hypothetical protein
LEVCISLRTRRTLTRLGEVLALGSPLQRPLKRLLRGSAGVIPEPSAQYAALDSRLRVVEAGVRHLEAALEGLQDAVHRRSQLDDQRNDELLRRTERAPGTRNPSDEDRRGRP